MAPSPACQPPSTLQMLEAVAASNNHNRDLSFLCSGISLSYHQSILTFHSPFLTNMLGALACCKCEKAQCGRKEEAVIVLDKVEVGTVQGLMEYLYKGECVVKDRRGVKEMQELVDMLGINLKLEIKNSKNMPNEMRPEGREPNLEETVGNLLVVEDAKSVEVEREITEDILKFAELFCGSDEDQKCSKCGEWLSKDNFMEHLKLHRETSQASLLSPRSSQTDDVYEASIFPRVKKPQAVVDDTSFVDNHQNKKSRISEEVKSSIAKFERGGKEIQCSECNEVVVKETFIEHFKIHANKLSNVANEASENKVGEKKKRGPKPGGGSKKESASRSKEVIDDTLNANKISINIPFDDKQAANGNGSAVPESKSKGKKRKKSEIALSEEEFADEYTCFNPTFKIKPGVKKVGKSAKKQSPVVTVPEIKLTFNLADLGLSEETIKLQDLSAGPTVDKARVDSSVKKVEDSTKKKKKSKVIKSDLTLSMSGEKSKETVNGTSIATSPTFSLPSSNSFPSFLRSVCSQADSLLPPGLDREHEELGRRVVHRLAGQRIEEGGDRKVTRDDVMKEMIDGIDDDENLNNVSSDGSEAPLVMDLSELDL